MPDLGIDLPIVSGDLLPPPSYPLCDVAAYITRFEQPYEPGVTYLSAHAQAGMFLPLLEASLRNDGDSLLGLPVDVFTDDGRRFGYRIERVIRHATDYAIISELPPAERSLILQTSEGPYGTTEKLQVLAALVDEGVVPITEAAPLAIPRDCRPQALRGDDGEGAATPTASPTASPIIVSAPTPPVAPIPLPSGDTQLPAPSGLGTAHVASRVVVERLGIDLPVVSGDLQPPPNYPFCDVAAYETFLAQPDEPGTTYLSAHAQEGMFLPILEASERRDGRDMLGLQVDVYTTDALRYRYEIWQVRRHILDRTIATEGLGPDEHRLVLQTSEGPYGTMEKVAVAARLVGIQVADPGTATPEARPRDCRPPGAQGAERP